MSRRTSLLAVAAALVVLLAVASGWVLLAGPRTPSQAEGEAWLSGFADLLTTPRALGARGPAALALFPGLGTWQPGACVTEWSRTDDSAPVVTYQRLELGRQPGDACDQAQFGMLSTTLRASDGITPGALVERFTDRFGRPEFHHDSALRGSLTYIWLVADGIFAHLDEPVGPGRADTFSLLFVRYYGAPTALPTPAEAERWMDATVALVAGPDLPRASAAEAIRQVGVEMAPDLRDGDGCPEEYDAPLDRHGPIGSHQSLWFKHEAGQPCEAARFQSFNQEVWRREPVTGDALVQRIAAKLGPPVVSRRPDRDDLSYRWTTPHGTTVELLEGLSGGMEHVIRLRVQRT